MTEILKRNPKEFAGFQTDQLDPQQISLRLCCARGCSSFSMLQITVPTGGYRCLCGRHAVLGHMMLLGVLGDTAPVAEIKEICSLLNLDFLGLLKSEPIHPTLPENFVCLRCGGGYLAETVGMYAGKRYIHNCGS